MTINVNHVVFAIEIYSLIKKLIKIIKKKLTPPVL